MFKDNRDVATYDKDASRTIRMWFTDRFVVSHAAWKLRRDTFSWTGRYIRLLGWAFWSDTFWFLMRLHQFNNFTTDTGYI